MNQQLATGSILIADDSAMPASARFARDSWSPGWGVFKDVTVRKLEQAIESGGWTFFFLAGAIRKTAYGFDGNRSLIRAVKPLLAGMDRNHFNCLQIDSVVRSSFLRIPYVTIMAHARHIQASGVMSAAARVPPVPYRNYV